MPPTIAQIINPAIRKANAILISSFFISPSSCYHFTIHQRSVNVFFNKKTPAWRPGLSAGWFGRSSVPPVQKRPVIDHSRAIPPDQCLIVHTTPPQICGTAVASNIRVASSMYGAVHISRHTANRSPAGGVASHLIMSCRHHQICLCSSCVFINPSTIANGSPLRCIFHRSHWCSAASLSRGILRLYTVQYPSMFSAQDAQEMVISVAFPLYPARVV